jgi:hypothetical protein
MNSFFDIAYDKNKERASENVIVVYDKNLLEAPLTEESRSSTNYLNSRKTMFYQKVGFGICLCVALFLLLFFLIPRIPTLSIVV